MPGFVKHGIDTQKAWLLYSDWMVSPAKAAGIVAETNVVASQRARIAAVCIGGRDERHCLVEVRGVAREGLLDHRRRPSLDSHDRVGSGFAAPRSVRELVTKVVKNERESTRMPDRSVFRWDLNFLQRSS